MVTGCLRNLLELPRNHRADSAIDNNRGSATLGYGNCLMEWLCVREDERRVQSLSTSESNLKGGEQINGIPNQLINRLISIILLDRMKDEKTHLDGFDVKGLGLPATADPAAYSPVLCFCQ